MYEHYDPSKLKENNQTTMDYLDKLYGEMIFDEIELTWELEDAVKLGHTEIVKCLSEFCKKVKNDFVEISKPALFASSESGQLEMMKILVENGADVKANGNYPVQLAAENGHKDSMLFLIKNGASEKVAYQNGNEEIKNAVLDYERES